MARDDASQLIERLGFIVVGMLCWKGATALWDAGTVPLYPVSLVLMSCGYVAGFVLVTMGVVERADVRKAWAPPCGFALIFASFVQIQWVVHTESATPTTDAAIYMDYAARLLRRGENPYEWSMVEAFNLFRAPFNLITPLIDGDLTGRVAYPALSFLVVVPFQWLGIPIWAVYPIFLFVALALLYRHTRPRLRPLVLAPFFADRVFVLYALGGVTDTVWVVLLLAMLLTWDRPQARAVWYGLACAYKHQPWVLAPYLVVRIWRETPGDRPARARAVVKFAAGATATFFVINGPFVLWSPVDWLLGVSEPVRAPMITFGQGLSAVTMVGAIVMPKTVYSALMFGTLGLTVWIYARHFRQLRELLWIAPAIALWLGNRGLTSYWYFNTIPLALALFRERPRPELDDGSPEPSWKPTRIAIAGAAATVVLCLVGFSQRREPFTMRVEEPLLTHGNHVEGVEVVVRNDGDTEVSPRFSVQSGGLQPFFWRIEEGPDRLAPGAEARYRIASEAPFADFPIHRGARLTVSDGRTFHGRTTITIPGEPDFLFPDVVPNGHYRFWESEREVPTFWGIVRSAPETGGVRRVESEPGDPDSVLALSIAAATPGVRETVALDTYLVLPEHPVELSVHPPPGANRAPSFEILYGMRLMVGWLHAWIVFGERPGIAALDDGTPVLVMEAPVGRWSTHVVDLRERLTELGVDLTPRRHKVDRFEHLDMPVTSVNFQLALSTTVGSLEARFGPVHTRSRRPDVERMTDRAIAAPWHLSAWLGAFNMAHRNYAKAEEHWAVAAKNDTSGQAHFLHGEAAFWAGDWATAERAYRAAIEREYEVALAYKGLGWTYYNRGDDEDAAEAFRRASEIFGERDDAAERGHHADALKGGALALARLGLCDASRLAANEAIALAPALRRDLSAIRCGR